MGDADNSTCTAMRRQRRERAFLTCSAEPLSAGRTLGDRATGRQGRAPCRVAPRKTACSSWPFSIAKHQTQLTDLSKSLFGCASHRSCGRRLPTRQGLRRPTFNAQWRDWIAASLPELQPRKPRPPPPGSLRSGFPAAPSIARVLSQIAIPVWPTALSGNLLARSSPTSAAQVLASTASPSRVVRPRARRALQAQCRDCFPLMRPVERKAPARVYAERRLSISGDRLPEPRRSRAPRAPSTTSALPRLFFWSPPIGSGRKVRGSIP